jgi:hypothetical protein
MNLCVHCVVAVTYDRTEGGPGLALMMNSIIAVHEIR